MSWHAIFVAAGKEDDVCLRIREILKHSQYEGKYELLVPKRKIQEKRQGQFVNVTIKMFPGYILINSSDISEIFHKTRKCNNLYKFLQTGHEFQEIQLEEISNIVYMVDDEGVIGVSDVFVENDLIKVTAGPLCNYSGWIKKIDKHKRRATVLFKFKGKNHFIDLSINFVRKPSDDEVKSELSFLGG